MEARFMRKSTTNTTLCLLLLALLPSVYAQGPNDLMINRIILLPDQPPSLSSTANNGVEWDCVSKTLTKTCLVYHNDQWFTFMIDKPGRYFLNAMGQQCRDKLGIQVIVIEGDPCKTQTYKLLQCIPKSPHDDFFVELEGLKPGIPYLVNIDGFLGDFCSFGLQLSTRPYGLPLNLNGIESLEMKSVVKGNVARIHWKISQVEDAELESFQIYRATGRGKATLVEVRPVIRNTIGVVQEDYELIDTLELLQAYRYQIHGIDQQGRSRYWNEVVLKGKIPDIPYEPRIVYFYPDFRSGDLYKVTIMDDGSKKIILEYASRFDGSTRNSLAVDLGKPIALGYTNLRILVTNPRTKQVLQSAYAADQHGEWYKKR